MNILYITHLTGQLSNGPNNSVPAQISAQSKYDNVFWWNLDSGFLEQWLETGLFHSVKDYPNGLISALPEPFNKPDIVVFEDFYYIDDVFHALECKFRKIPYIIVPRSALTQQGQSQKHLKKVIANLIAFGSMVKNATAIQYLTENELKDSGKDWNKCFFIEPNGIFPAIKEYNKKDISKKIVGTYIGRFDIYHKGLDLLFDSIVEMKGTLRNENITINLYGPELNGQKGLLQKKVLINNVADILKINPPIFGDDKKEVLLKSDFFILTSRYEGMPMSIIEAMSFGLPCFVSRGSNMSDVIGKNRAGWICENSVESIKNAFNQLIDNKANILEYGKNAYTLSLSYNWGEIAKRTHDHYEKLINN